MLIICLMLAVIIALILFLPYQAKRAHARAYAKTQIEFMREQLDNNNSEDVVLAMTQARITEEQIGNTETDYTWYIPHIDKGKCWVQVEICYKGRESMFKVEEK